MRGIIRNLPAAIVGASVLLLAACSSTTTIRSDLVLKANDHARIQLRQETQAIDLHNDSGAPVRVRVLDKKDRVLSNMLLGGHDQARLDLLKARAVQLSNDNDRQAVVRWTLSNDDRIEYDLALNPTTP
ncbi:MAG: hypothetical protein ACYS5V_16250 [Planctomycetota bacterium]|jgi:hypothetical protein